MNKSGLAAALLCAIGMTACAKLREPNDAQLTALLHSEFAKPGDPAIQLDGYAVDCLRALSGDKELVKGLPVRIAGEDGVKTCRAKLDAWIADAARNPDKFGFDDVSAPKTVRHAMTLLEANRLAMATHPAARQAPAALAPPITLPPPTPIGVPDPNVNLGAAGARLVTAENLCRQTQEAAAKENADAGLKSFAEYCTDSLARLRSTMEQSARNRQGDDRLDAIAVGADNMANVARSVLAKANK
jgi:hypothetical protein